MMNLNDIPKDFIPKKVMTIYSNESDVYIEIQNVVQLKNNQFDVKSSRPLTKRAFKELFELAQMKKEEEKEENESLFINDIVPENIIELNPDPKYFRISWYVPPKIYDLSFRKDMKLKKGLYPMPGFIYNLEHRDISIYAFKGNKPKKGMTLYHPPIFNTSGANSICWGNVKRKESFNINKIMQTYEDALWKSIFTSHGPGNVKGDIYELYRSIFNKEKFPNEYLVKTYKSHLT